MNSIPSIDLSDFISDDSSRKQKFVDAIGKAYEEIGFVALKGHFLNDALVENLYTEVKNFFSLPTETKRKYEIPGIGGQRGYVSFGKESAKGKKEGDLKEFWHFGQYVDDNAKLKSEYPDNVTVNELPGFNKIGKETYQMLEKTAKYVLRALALHLDLEETYFDNYIHNGNSILWLDAIAEPNELMINVGDMLSRHTNNKLKSTIHRVVNPPKELWGTSRYSIPFFMHPISEMKLDVLEGCIDENNPKQ